MRIGAATVLCTVALVAGCATDKTVSSSAAPPQAACMKGYYPSFGAFLGGTQGIVKIRGIDGVARKGRTPTYCVEAGKHQIEVEAVGGGYTQDLAAVDYVDFEFAPARRYILRGVFQGISFVMDVVDVTTDQETIAAQFKLKAMPAMNGQVVVPVLVPHR